MRLGEMLIRDGKISSAELEAAIEAQGRRGGRLGTVLVEIGAIEVETLTSYLALELGVQAVTRRELDRARDAALRLLPRDLCTRRICLPYDVRERHLLVAMRDPHDLEALDEIAEVAGRAPIPRVAPEITIAYYLHEYYDVPPPKRVAALGERAAGEAQPSEEPATPRPLPGLPPPPKRVPPPPSAPLRPVQVAQTAFATPRPNAAPPPPVPAATGAAQAARAERAPVTAAATAPVAVAQAAIPAPTPAPTPAPAPPPPRLDFQAAHARVNAATSRAEIADAVLGYARDAYELAMLLLVRDDIAVGWRGFALAASGDRIETLLVPLGRRSPFEDALSATGPVRLALPSSAVVAHVCKILRTEVPREIVVAPIRIRDRVVNLLYAHPLEAPTDEQLAELTELTTAAGEAYARMIQSLKRHGEGGEA